MAVSFFEELKRRNVIRVAVAYVISAWLVAQVLELLFDSFGTPEWVMKTILVLMGFGLVFAVVFAWAFELTPDGIKREAEVDRTAAIRSDTGKKLDRTIIVVLALTVVYFAWRSQAPSTDAVTPVSEVAVSAPAIAEPPSKDTERMNSVAVLPFVNMSADPEQEYFSDGITEEIINAVVKIPGIAVPARTSVFGYKGHQGDVRQIGDALGVTHILEGSVRSQGQQVRITAQLIKVDDGFHLWSETFDRNLMNIFQVQEEIAASIADVLIGELGTELAPVPNRTTDMRAYDVYLKGRAALRKRRDEAVALFEQAIEADPDFAPAWAALAIAHQSITEDNDKAITAARKALDIDPDNVDGLNAMGGALRDKTRWVEAEQYLDKALSIDPNSAELLEDYSEFLAFAGRTEEALLVTTRGMEIDPQLLPLVWHHAEMLLAHGHVEEARSLMVQTMSTRGDLAIYFWINLMPVWLSAQEGGAIYPLPEAPPIPEEAPASLAEMVEFIQQVVRDPKPELAGRVKSLVSDVTPNPDSLWVSNLARSLERNLLVYLGDIDFVIEKDIALASEPEGLRYFTWTPLFAPLRSHPRFAEYLQAINLIDYWDATRWPDWCSRNDDGVVTCR